MNEQMHTFFSSAVASLILWVSLGGMSSAHANNPPSNRPPGYGSTSAIGTQIKAAENGVIPWQKSAVGELADNNTYDKKLENDAFVNAVIDECMKAGNKNKQCIFAGGTRGLELLISSLLGSYAFDDSDLSKPTQRDVAVHYIKNLTFGMPDYPGDEKVFKDKDKKDKLSEEGYKYFAQIFRQLPMVSVAQNAMLAMVGDRTRLAGLSAGMPVGKDNAASIIEMLHYEAMRRYADPKWFSDLSDPYISTDRAVMAEIAYLLAFQNYMMVKTYEQNAQTQALLVAQLSGMNSMTGQLAGVGNSVNQNDIQKQIDKKK